MGNNVGAKTADLKFFEMQQSDRSLNVLRLGRSSYLEVWNLQKEMQRARIAKAIEDTVIVCEHEPVVTLGTSGKRESILAAPEVMKERGVEVFEVERGGDATYHGPGQLVLYPILDLSLKKRDVHWYMRRLEDCLIKTLEHYSVSSEAVSGKTGVWIRNLGPGKRPRKIASLGVRISRWCTMHGLALNVSACNEGFSLINPCGFTDIEITSIEQESGLKFDVWDVADKLLDSFSVVFGYAERRSMPPEEISGGLSLQLSKAG
ncbi:MAG: lipoyl(octanoyl) transferase LipB [Deltaproteobacteria bacterium]|nr:lipoyl(octanoyl) transferase LipB [Deltaproteobacteria bacterium]